MRDIAQPGRSQAMTIGWSASRPPTGRPAKAAEAALVFGAREGVTPLLAWLAGLAGGTLVLMPVIRTAYIGFLFTCLLAAWLTWRGERLADFGLAIPTNWRRALAWGVGIFFVVLLYAVTLEPLLDKLLVPILGPNGGAASFRGMRGDLGAFLFVLPFIWPFAALGEEFRYRGYLMTRLEEAFGGGRAAAVAAALIQAAMFGLAHLYQGWTGAIGVSIYGLFNAFGARICGRNLLPAIIAHGLLDTLGFTLLFLGAM